MTHRHENMKSVKGRRAAGLWWPLQNGCTKHNPLQIALIGLCVRGFQLIAPLFFVQKKSPIASKVVIDSDICFLSLYLVGLFM